MTSFTMSKKLVALLLVAILVVASLTGCTGGGKKEDAGESTTPEATTEAKATEEASTEGSNPVSDEPVTFTMLYADNASYAYNAEWPIWEAIREATNVTLDLMVVPDADYTTKQQTLFASGNIPDIVTKTDPGKVNSFGLNGVFLPFNQHLDKLPAFEAFAEKYDFSDDLAVNYAADGNLYVIPAGSNEKRISSKQWMVRKDIFEKHDIPIPTDLDSLYEAGLKLKELYPDSTPITNRFKFGNIGVGMGLLFNTDAGWNLGPATYGYTYDVESGEFIFQPLTENYKAMIEYMRKLYAAGILDPEYATLESNVYEERAMNGDQMILWDWVVNMPKYFAGGTEIDPDYNMAVIEPISGIDGKKNLGYTNKIERSMAVPSSVMDKDYFETLMKYINWVYTDEAIELMSWGPEGIAWDMVDGERKFKDEVYAGEIIPVVAYGVANNSITIMRPMDHITELFDENTANMYNAIADTDWIKPPRPAIKFSLDETDELALLAPGLIDYVNQMTEQFIDGKLSMDQWDEFVKGCEEKKYKEVGEIFSKVWAEQK